MEIKEQVLEVLRNVNPNIADNVEANLLETGLIDSFEIVNVVLELEDAFDIIIDPELVLPENFQTINNIVKLVENIRNQ